MVKCSSAAACAFARCAEPPRLPGKTLWLVIRTDTLDWPEDAHALVLRHLGQWRSAGNRVAGVQVDFDARTRHLERYAAFLRGVTRAGRRINADKRRYLRYFKQGWAADDPAVQALTDDDFNLGRIQLRAPTPIPEGEARWAWDWMASWGVLQGDFDVAAQINRKVQHEAHELAAAGPVG